jgi:hypothetical protein
MREIARQVSVSVQVDCRSAASTTLLLPDARSSAIATSPENPQATGPGDQRMEERK